MYIADLHIHSRYSRATSKDCTPEYLDLWARRKGIHIVGTGDFTHPAWREELQEKLEPAEEGLYVLKEAYRIADETADTSWNPRFLVTGEISSIYKKNGRVRKVHSLILLPGLEDAERISRKLEEIGNIHSDGRPILGLDCRDLLEITMELSPRSVYIPAHIWTPHFSLFGAFSGFESAEECFEDLTPYVHAVETGLSSDPPMNWRVSALDGYHLVSNSDAHSPAKLGREATLLDTELSYKGVEQAIQTGKGLYGTIEFFPEEGKYHMDGHRKCHLCLTPAQTERYGGICPVCGKKITIGVSHRVEALADRPGGYAKPDAGAFESLVPLPEVIASVTGHGAASAGVQREYLAMLKKLGPEFEILREIPLEDIRQAAGDRIAQGIARLRRGQVERIPGFDGEYGVIRLFTADELANPEGQMDFLDMLGAGKKEEPPVPQKPEQEEPGSAEPVPEETGTVRQEQEPNANSNLNPDPGKREALNEEQRRAVTAPDRRIAVTAGPGTGKTKTLTARIQYLLEYRKVKPGEITAVTFTNQAAEELRSRLADSLGGKRKIHSLQTGTFHGICYAFLKEMGRPFSLAGEEEMEQLAGQALTEAGCPESTETFFRWRESGRKSGPEETPAGNPLLERAEGYYERAKREQNLLDFEDLLLETAQIFEEGKAGEAWEKRFSYLLVDEFQDSSPLQYRLIKAWNRKGRELFVIGDADQSIYGFRGADAGCFERLEEEGAPTRIRLTENYRSPAPVLKAALEVISRNPGEKRILHVHHPGTLPVRLVKNDSRMSEGIFIAKEINRLTGGIGMLDAQKSYGTLEGREPCGFDDIAVLYRTHYQANVLETCLKKEGIPYIVTGREDFLKEEEIRGSLAFFRFLENPEDERREREALELLWKLDWNEESREVARRTAENLRKAYEKEKPLKFLALWQQEAGITASDSMKHLENMAVCYSDMREFCQALLLGVESDLKRPGERNYRSGAVRLMTLHGAKGLEFPVVFLCGVEKGKIPLEKQKGPADVEEERRLLYVGMTRAKEELILTTSGEVSGFLEELPEGVILEEKGREKRTEPRWEQLSLFDERQ